MELKYENGQIGAELLENGSGFLYYPNGSVAVAISEVSSYQNAFYAYDKNRRGTILLGFDELANGFATTTSRKGTDIKNRVIVSSKNGCLVSEEGKIIHEWLWDRNAINCGKEPPSSIQTELNENLKLIFKDRTHITLEFKCESISRTMDLGAKTRRTDNYLEHSKREVGGHLIPQIDYVSLKERQSIFNESCRDKRNKLHPKSENLSEMVKDIVAQLEANFGDVSERMTTSPGIGSLWKSEALAKTLDEIPRIPICNQETGITPGFGKHLYVPSESIDLSKTLPPNFVTSSGAWKGEVEIRTAIREMNPPLARSGILKANSGRYSDSLVVDKTAVTADNPTGMATVPGLPLDSISWVQWKEEFSSCGNSTTAPLTVLLVSRRGDVKGHRLEKIAEVANLELDATSVSTSTKSRSMKSSGMSSGAEGARSNDSKSALAGVRIMKIDVCENNEVVSDVGIKDLPTFLFYKGSHLAYAGTIGGRKVKVNTTGRPSALVIEPNFKFQISIEKVLKKLGCDIFLCLSIPEAIERITQLTNVGGDGPSIIFDLVIISDELSSADVGILGQRLNAHVKSHRTIVAGSVSVLGDKGSHNLSAVAWQEGFSDDVGKILPLPLSNLAHVVVQKPLKAASVVRALGMRIIPPQDSNFGLTPETLLAKIRSVHDDMLGRTPPPLDRTGIGGAVGGQYVGIKLSAEDFKMRGKALVR